MVSLALIRTISLFTGIQDDILQQIATTSILKRYARGQVILQAQSLESRAVKYLYILLSGSVRVFIQHLDGKEVILAELKRQDFFGEMGLLDNLPPSASVETLEESEALLVPETVFKQHLMDDPHMSIAIIRALVHRLREADRKIESLALLDVYGRIARLFLDLSEEIDGVRVIPKAPPKQEIARQIGASREMVSRVVRHLEESGTVLVQKRTITLLKAFRVS
ncbi:MAG: Crp/Fnr family transcriptional regulator [Betaproteobacteria bacterium]|jgi:CRP/FNR family cyclic AMP-dependent transcriptional regulator|nr:Crp/Fnr family transcriptional regulator [Betaproteobacteria bacterium]